jgi:hypothetical protein
MKARDHNAPREERRACLRSRCKNLGKARLQERKAGVRVIYLCDGCFGSLPVAVLNDLFVRSGIVDRKQR